MAKDEWITLKNGGHIDCDSPNTTAVTLGAHKYVVEHLPLLHAVQSWGLKLKAHITNVVIDYIVSGTAQIHVITAV